MSDSENGSTLVVTRPGGSVIGEVSHVRRADSPRQPGGAERPAAKRNKLEQMKLDKDGLDMLPDIERYAACGDPEQIAEDDAQRMKWFGLFVRKQTPGHMMMRLRSVCGRMTARQWRVIAELSDRNGKGFCDLTTRQQVQMRWFTIGDVPQIWRQLHEVGLTSLQTGMDNVRGVCGCPAAGLTPNELFDASPVARQFTKMLVGNKEFSNPPRKFNVTITGCLENCCHPETQDIGLVPAVKEQGERGRGGQGERGRRDRKSLGSTCWSAASRVRVDTGPRRTSTCSCCRMKRLRCASRSRSSSATTVRARRGIARGLRS